MTGLGFLEPVVWPTRTSRLLWRYDRGRHPRRANILQSELATRSDTFEAEEFTILHRYLLVGGRLPTPRDHE